VSPKQFRQTLANLGFTMSDFEIEAIVQIYGTDKNEVKYMEFINDGTPVKTGLENEMNLTKKPTYVGHVNTFKGAEEFEGLIFKLKAIIKKDRIRLNEFFQDHDILRKGVITSQKFRGVLYA
jgi:hypothetical protein